MKLIWLGHGSFRIETGEAVLLLDPWLTGNPMLSEDQHAAAITGATHILMTHAHFDHSVDVVRLAKELSVPVVGQYDVMGWWAESEGIETIDIAKSLIDEGYHPMTMYFPLVVHGAMLIEPTESESKAELDRFCDSLESIARRAAQGDETLKGAPYLAPMRRLDETQAARKPVLKWTAPDANSVAAE